MKKFFVLILAFFYLLVSSGIALNEHYCMGYVSSVDLTHKDKCSKCGMKTGAGGCCKNQVKIIKLNDSHNLSSCVLNILSPVAVIENRNNEFDSKLYASAASASLNNHSPPARSGISLCILHSIFRI